MSEIINGHWYPNMTSGALKAEKVQVTPSVWEWRNPNNGRLVCSPEHPMPKGATGRWEHTNVIEIGEQEPGSPSGDIQKYRCTDCGHEWREELPQ